MLSCAGVFAFGGGFPFSFLRSLRLSLPFFLSRFDDAGVAPSVRGFSAVGELKSLSADDFSSELGVSGIGDSAAGELTVMGTGEEGDSAIGEAATYVGEAATDAGEGRGREIVDEGVLGTGDETTGVAGLLGGATGVEATGGVTGVVSTGVGAAGAGGVAGEAGTGVETTGATGGEVAGVAGVAGVARVETAGVTGVGVATGAGVVGVAGAGVGVEVAGEEAAGVAGVEATLVEPLVEATGVEVRAVRFGEVGEATGPLEEATGLEKMGLLGGAAVLVSDRGAFGDATGVSALAAAVLGEGDCGVVRAGD